MRIIPRLASKEVLNEISVQTSFAKLSLGKTIFHRNKIAGVLPEMKIRLLNTTAGSYDTTL